MIDLKIRNSSVALLLGFVLMGCQSTNSFRMESIPDPGGNLTVIHTASARIRQECVFLDAEGDNSWRHLYIMYVLNDRNEVLEVFNWNHVDLDYCRRVVRETEKLLRDEPQVRICSRFDPKPLEGPEARDKTISFGALGRHPVTHGRLVLDSICNSQSCVGDNGRWKNTCPGFVKREWD